MHHDANQLLSCFSSLINLKNSNNLQWIRPDVVTLLRWLTFIKQAKKIV